jgi:hypothetical protein
MNAATLSHASGRDDSVEVLWEDAERVFCRLLQKDAEGHRPAFAPILAGAEHPTFESINRLASEYKLKEYFEGAAPPRPVEQVSFGVQILTA